MAPTEISNQLSERIDLNSKLNQLLGDLDHIDEYYNSIKEKQGIVLQELTDYSSQAETIALDLSLRKEELSATVGKIDDFLEEVDAVEKIDEFETRLTGYAKSTDFDILKKKVNELSRKLSAISTSMDDFVRQSNMEDEIATLQAELEESRKNETKLNQNLEDLTKKVKQLETQTRASASIESKMQTMLERIQKLETAGADGSLQHRTIHQNIDDTVAAEASSQSITDAPSVPSVSKENNVASSELLARVNQIISKGTQEKQEILIESLSSISDILEKYGID